MKNLIIIGAGDWGLEIYSWIRQAKGYGLDWQFKGFLDDDLDKLDSKKYLADEKIISRIEEYEIEEEDVFVCAIANPSVKEKVVSVFSKKNARFINYIHNSVIFF
jgi:hypothetical protein